MDIRQPSLYGAGIQGGTINTVEARWKQDIYRALKTPNCAMTTNQEQACATGTATHITWNVPIHNYLNLYDTTNNTIAPQGVPGVYYIEADVKLKVTGAVAPTVGNSVFLAVADNNGAVRTTCIYRILPTITYTFSSHVWNLRVSCLEYLNGNRTGSADAARKIILWNDSGVSISVAAPATGEANNPRLHAFKIAY
jgi:hypothetical protein